MYCLIIYNIYMDVSFSVLMAPEKKKPGHCYIIFRCWWI